MLDVGILAGTYPLMQCFADLLHILVEPVRLHYDNIRNVYSSRNIKFRLFECAASDHDGTVVLCEYATKGGDEITHSQIVPNLSMASTKYLYRTADVAVRRVESIVKECQDDGTVSPTSQFLLKIDVDGIEEQIIAGAQQSLNLCSVVVLEVPIRKINGRLALLESLGFELVDIVDPCYYHGALSQVDCIFVKSALVNQFGVDPWRTHESIDFGQWYEGRYALAG